MSEIKALGPVITRNVSSQLREAALGFPSITLTGPRQSGKSTICQQLFPHLKYLNLEHQSSLQLALSDPETFLSHGNCPHGAFIDEAQNAPELLSYLMILIDQDRTPGKWIVTGSQNFALMESVSQSLAGRTAVFELLPLSR